MSNVVPFPASRRVPAKAIPREEFEQLAELALDVVERIVALLDDRDEEAAFPTDESVRKADSPRCIQIPADRLEKALE
ncbi:hypothetical protein [Methylobacterium sp. GC_Met_2]|uniref:hypothetical protein n=1 Tax=Methylobacterium sp. GC_Met_2 TaxID=2937376 RepID=UPI00226B0881|nr:hypothetical protein [Methylobacterium sp. GC_Met_2]